MGTVPEIIDGKAVKSLAEARAIRSVLVLGRPGGWSVVVRYGEAERTVAAQRSRRPRLWRNLATAAAYVRHELGLERFEVDTADHDPEAIERKRPDQTERLRRQREAAAHDGWFRAEVQRTLDGLAAGTTALFSEEEHERRWREKRAELRDRYGRGG